MNYDNGFYDIVKSYFILKNKKFKFFRISKYGS